MSTHHGFGPELGNRPITYTCRCGYRNTAYSAVADHITAERTKAHAPRLLTTIPAADLSQPAGIEIASTPYGDEYEAIEIRLVVRESVGNYPQHSVRVRRSSIPFLIDALEAHRLDDKVDPCAACAAQAFAARLTAASRTITHTCPEHIAEVP
jgi:hypothetical protein